ncbi:MAG: DUF928 domain-containing protein [Desulfobacterales bacterium]|nr:DUF928 domain-containing protein [Desulfobacterales bacterium]
MKFVMASKKRDIVFCILIFLLALCHPSPAISQGEKIPVYNSGDTNKEGKSRMEAGQSADGSNRSVSVRSVSVRSVSVRGLSRSVSVRSLTRKTDGNRDEQTMIPLPSRMSPLAPENTGLTLTGQPVLQWYISGPWPDKIEFRLNAPKVPEPDIDTDIKGPDKEGIYRISIADYNAILKPGVNYEWVLTIINDEEERSADFTACARIRYVKPDENLSKLIMNTPKEKLYYVYADRGYWYDALENLSQLIDARPDDKMLRLHRSELLRQVGLAIAADYDSRETSE